MSTLFCSLLPHIIDKVFIRKILGMDYRFKMDFKLVYKRFSQQIRISTHSRIDLENGFVNQMGYQRWIRNTKNQMNKNNPQ